MKFYFHFDLFDPHLYFDNYMLEEEKNEKMNNKYNINEIEKKIKNFNDSKDCLIKNFIYNNYL